MVSMLRQCETFKCKTLDLAPVVSQVQILEVRRRQIIPVPDQCCQEKNFIFDRCAKVLYNYCIDGKE
jgi:hypothetical protein